MWLLFDNILKKSMFQADNQIGCLGLLILRNLNFCGDGQQSICVKN